MIDFIDPQGIMQLSAIAKANGHQTFLGILTRENVFKKIEKIKPRVIAYSATTGEHKYYLKINEEIKKRFPNIFAIMGGPHVTFYPECIYNSTLDAICIGEGDEAFLELLQRLERNEDISNIKNIATKEKRNDIRSFYSNLDNLPFPDRDIFYKTTEMGKFPIKSFMISRGCPYNCTYCFNQPFREMYKGKGSYLRRKSVGRSIDEIVYVKERYPIQFVKFYDDIFAYPNDAWLEDFCKEYKKKIKLPFHCLTRPDLFNEDMAGLLKEAGCVSISMSIEAANPYLRNEILKRNMDDEQIYKAFKICQEYKINTFANSILALPNSKIQDDIATVLMNIKCRVTFAEFPICHPYPGTPLGEFCRKNSIFDADYDKIHLSYMFESPLNCFTKREKKIQKNLSLLGTVVVWRPRLKNLILNYLIYIPNSIFYILAYILVKMYLIKTKIYPFRLKVSDFSELFFKGLRIDVFKHSAEV
ncbi:MAG: B12-binding domain-containing radical SAM protein [Candidatus Omnitrophica bacterium]|nr:B12-binding domain-containing radical SAM protein [Candidatus Omnitrophota bacterium]